MAYIGLHTYNPTCNLIGRPNVRISDEPKPSEPRPYETNKAIYETLDKLTTDRPNWIFVADSFSSSLRDGEYVRVVTGFDILCDGETLGSVGLSYHGRGYKITVSNERVKRERERASSYRTEIPEKAALCIRKKFYSKVPTELFADAVSGLGGDLDRAKRRADNVVEVAVKDMYKKAKHFIDDHMEEYVSAYGLQDTKAKLDEAREERRAVHTMNEMFDKDKGSIVLLFNSLYIVKDLEKDSEIKSLSDEQLNEEMRMKIGLLKLSAPGQLISNVGCRINNTAMYLLPQQ